MSCSDDKGVTNVIVFHIGTKSNNTVKEYKHLGGFKNHIDRDVALTMFSDIDIAWVREGDELSGTAQNIYRRKLKDIGDYTIEEIINLSDEFCCE